jgi:NTE family protein
LDGKLTRHDREEAAMATRALVLGGGGPVGIAWESGLVSGFAEAGVDLSDADFIMGTSAGSFVGARLALGEDARGMVRPFLAAKEVGERAVSQTRPAGPPPDLNFLMRKMAEASAGDRPGEEVRKEIGAWAAEQLVMSEEAFIQTFGRAFSSLPETTWPAKRYACTAVDIETGGFRLWDNDSGVGVTRAVASSCSVPGVYPPITIDGRRYMDGGMRSGTNADMAKGHDLVVVVALRLDAGASPEAAARLRAPLERELKVLRDGGARVELITPDDASQAAFGPNLMDPRRRGPAAEAGLAQGRAGAAGLAEVWRG